jgi:hypothetical protein
MAKFEHAPVQPKKGFAGPPMPHRSVVALVLFTTALSLLPVLLGLSVPTQPRNAIILYGTLYGPAIVAVFLCYFLDRKVERKQKLNALLLCLVLALVTNYLHLWLVDNASYSATSNLVLQKNLHESVIGLAPEALPHSYRFLPNSFIRLLEMATGDFASARDGYRNLFVVLLLYALYRFARLFLRHGGALCCLALWTAVIPVSFRYYAGQANDPLSHLSFLLSFIFLETEQFAYFVLTLVIGALTKETILAMSGYYALVSWKDKRSRWRAAILLLTVLIVFFGVRALILQRAPGSRDVSGVDFTHSVTNWRNYLQWCQSLLFTCGIFIPFVVLGWRTLPWRLRSVALYLFPILFVSSLFFSWLREARNFMPVVAIFVVMTVHYLFPQERRDASRTATTRASV